MEQNSTDKWAAICVKRRAAESRHLAAREGGERTIAVGLLMPHDEAHGHHKVIQGQVTLKGAGRGGWEARALQ